MFMRSMWVLLTILFFSNHVDAQYVPRPIHVSTKSTHQIIELLSEGDDETSISKAREIILKDHEILIPNPWYQFHFSFDSRAHKKMTPQIAQRWLAMFGWTPTDINTVYENPSLVRVNVNAKHMRKLVASILNVDSPLVSLLPVLFVTATSGFFLKFIHETNQLGNAMLMVTAPLFVSIAACAWVERAQIKSLVLNWRQHFLDQLANSLDRARQLQDLERSSFTLNSLANSFSRSCLRTLVEIASRPPSIKKGA